ncbi:MAG: HD domain-containing protein [Gammaproteobacteria bacterium]|nr:HD domain-containing protein [Gammaproteobacteria bacterium]
MIKKASQFASAAHAAIDQRRKYSGEPYIVHPAAVAKLVTSVSDDEAMICAAWLHDVVEDTTVTIVEIEIEFGDDIASLVADLTDVSSPAVGNREARKLIDLKHTQAASPRAKTVKLADLIDNSSSIELHDPGFAKIYMAEKSRLLGVLQEGDQTLLAMATEIIEAYYKR